MITPIKTNQLNVALHEKAFDEKYDLFRVETTDKYFKHGAYTMDAPLLCNNVVSVFFESGRSFYVLMRKAASNKNALISVFSATEDAEKIAIFPVMVDEADHRVVVSLLLNALGSYELDYLRFNNLTGHLYCFHPKWLKKSMRNNESVITDDISFGIRKTIQDADRYFFMKVSPNGVIDFFEQILNMFEINDYVDCMNIFAESKDVVGVIRYANGDINVIRETDWITIPEIEKIQESLAAGDTHLRGKDKRKELLSAVTDIKLFDNQGKTYYFVGIIGEGMRTNINRAANIRVIDLYKGDTSMFEALLPLMNVTFVRNGQLTVIPFPFKYLREYIKLSEI